jgi:hypothetical protein
MISIAAAEDVLLVDLEEYDVAIFRLQIRAHVGV